MAIEPLTVNRIAELGRAIVAEFGDEYIDTTNAYAVLKDTADTDAVEANGIEWGVDNELIEPGCLVGQMLYRAGVPLVDLFRLGDELVQNLPDEWFADDAAQTFAEGLQGQQDTGRPWSRVMNTREG